jgi:glycosyltransferase involved in cell wall biosynthesis
MREQFDAVVLSGDASYVSTWLAAILLRIKRTPVLMWTIGWHRPEYGLRRLIRMTFYGLADRLLLYGQVAYELGRAHGYPPTRMAVIGNSQESCVAQRPPTAVPALRGLGRDGAIGAVARLTATKRFDLLIEAASILGGDGHEVTVVLAGAGPEEDRLRGLALRRNVDLRLVGPLYDPGAIASLYTVLRLTVVPGSIGLTAVQSLSHGVPVISGDDPYSQKPEWSAIKPGRTGAFYRAGDSADLAQRLGEWLGRSGDDRNRAVDECLQEFAAHWTAQAHAARMCAEIALVLRSSRHGA